jgi:glucosamine-6-phosphate deaminase
MGKIAYPFQTRIAGINVGVYADKPALGAAAARFVAGCLQQAIRARGQAVMILATGASQYEFLEALVRAPGVAWPRVMAFHLDEYLGIAPDHPASFRRYLHERVFSHLPLGAVHLLQGDAPDPQAEARRYAGLLAQQVVDIACIGIGENGHLAFNDPPADFHSRAGVQIQTLDLACRRQQVGEGHFAAIEEVPRQALTLTVPAILAARTISCVTPDQRKAAPVRAALEGPLTPDCPASALRTHPDCHLFLDPASASLLASW